MPFIQLIPVQQQYQSNLNLMRYLTFYNHPYILHLAYSREHPCFLLLVKRNPFLHTQRRSLKVQFPLGVHSTVIFVDLPSLETAFSGHATLMLMLVVDESTCLNSMLSFVFSPQK